MPSTSTQEPQPSTSSIPQTSTSIQHTATPEAPILTPVIGQLCHINAADDDDFEAPQLTPAVRVLHQGQELISTQCCAAKRAQECQADRMLKRRRFVLTTAKVGDTVTIPIPLVDRGRGDPRNVLGKIVSHDEEKDLFKIAVRSGILNGHYSRTQFEVCSQALLDEDDINQQQSVSLREAAMENSCSGGQGFLKCNRGANQCKNNRCKCYKAKLKCNSRCHSSLTCKNK